MEQKYIPCNHCTYKLVSIAYKRAPWFRLFRETLRFGMRWLVRLHHIDLDNYIIRTPGCESCIRFYKTELFEKSFLFRRLHNLLNPVFNKIIARLVTNDERKQAKIYADAASEGKLTDKETEEWMRDLKPGL